jgi:archaemetzincin
VNDDPTRTSGSAREQDKGPADVEIVPLGSVNEVALAVVRANLTALLGLTIRESPALAEPEYALIPSRRQYDASRIIKAHRNEKRSGRLRLLVTEKDLCLPMLSHVFGQAHLEAGVTVISLKRLGNPDPAAGRVSTRLFDRLAKIAIHEVAHTLGVRHCRQEGCLMNFSLDLDHLDRLDLAFCPGCWIETQAGLRRLRGPASGDET